MDEGVEHARVRTRFTGEGRFIRTDTWKKEGKYVDLWSAVHVLSGIAIGFYPRYFHFGIFAAFVVVFLLLVMYEMFEVIVKIEEFPTNRVTDVLFGLLGFTPAYFFDMHLGGSTSILVCGIATTIAILVSTVGWVSSYKATVLEQKLRTQFERERGLLRERLAERRRRKLERSEQQGH